MNSIHLLDRKSFILPYFVLYCNTFLVYSLSVEVYVWMWLSSLIQWLACQNVCLSVFGRVFVGGWYDLHICTWLLISIAPIILHHIINSDLSNTDRSIREGHLRYLLWLFCLSSTALLASIPDVRLDRQYRQCFFKLLDNTFWDFAEYICFHMMEAIVKVN